MERQEDALNKQREQSISYNGTINIALVDGEQEDADFFYTLGENAQINKLELKENWCDCGSTAIITL